MPELVFGLSGALFLKTHNQEPSFLLTKKDGEFLRVVASVSVVMAHCVHFWVEGFFKGQNYLSLGFLASIFDQITRFTVPLFFFISGFGLTLQLQGKTLQLKEFYRRRLAKILAPFALWSLITSLRHIEYFERLPWSADPAAAAGRFFRFLFLDGFDYQYYFLIVIFQFYLVYPLLYKWARSRRFLTGFLVLHLCLLSPVEAFLEPLGVRLPQFHPNFLIYHLLYCCAGIYAAGNKDFLADLVRRWGRRRVVGFWFGTIVLMVVEFVANMRYGKSLGSTDHFNRWSVVLYCLASLLLFLRFKAHLAEKVYPFATGRFLFTYVAPYTFFVYLAHTHVLRAVDYLLWEITVFDFINRIILVVGGTYLLAWFAQWLLEDFPGIRFSLGLPRKGVIDWAALPGARLFRLRSAAAAGRGGAAGNLSASSAEKPRPAAMNLVGDTART